MWTRRSTAVIALCLGGLAFNALMIAPSLVITAHGLTDFMDLYAGGRLAFDGHLYDPAHLMAAEAASEGWSSPTRLFMRLPGFAVLYWPLAQLPYLTASALWEALCVASLIAFTLLWPARKRWHAVLAGCASLPAWMVVAEGQDLGFILCAMAGSALLLRKKRPLAAGAIASLCLAKYHLFLMVPVWICARRKWRFGQGLLAGSAAILAVSFAASGWAWPLHYYALLRQPASNPYTDLMPNLHALFTGLPHPDIAELSGLMALTALVWFVSRRGNERGLAAALAAGILGAPHAYMADAVLLIPAALLLLKDARTPSLLVMTTYLLTPLPWLLLLHRIGYPSQLALCALLAAVLWSAPKPNPGLRAAES